MKKILSTSLLLAALVVAFTGCLKDKGFENHTYGINDPDSQPPGVGFPKAASAKNSVGVDLSSSPQTINELVFVNLESGSPASSDVHITLVLDDAIRVAYNNANGTNILAMPTSLFTVQLNLTIPAGQRFIQVPLVITNTSTLNPNNTYGIGIRIASVDGGYKIAENLKNLFIEIGLKNKYDGVYNLRGYHNRPGLTAPYNETVHMITTGPNSVTMGWPANTSQFYSHPLNGGTTYYGSFTTNFYFNLATDILTSWDMTPWATTVTPSVTPGTNSRYDPATKKIYANFYYNGNPGARQFWDTLTYLGPR